MPLIECNLFVNELRPTKLKLVLISKSYMNMTTSSKTTTASSTTTTTTKLSVALTYLGRNH